MHTQKRQCCYVYFFFPRKKSVDRAYIGEKLEYEQGDSNILFYTFLKLTFYLKK